MEPVKIIYDCAVLLFTGNMISGLLLKIFADKTQNPVLIARAFKRIVKSDLFISVPALTIILFLNYYINGSRAFPYTSLKLFHIILITASYSVLVFIFLVHPLRYALIDLVSWKKSIDQVDITGYKKLSHKWAFFGVLELTPLLLVLLFSMC